MWSHRIEQHHIGIDKEVGFLEKARPPLGVMALRPNLVRAGQYARNQTGILDQSRGKLAGLQLTFALRRHAKKNAR